MKVSPAAPPSRWAKAAWINALVVSEICPAYQSFASSVSAPISCPLGVPVSTVWAALAGDSATSDAAVATAAKSDLIVGVLTAG